MCCTKQKWKHAQKIIKRAVGVLLKGENFLKSHLSYNSETKLGTCNERSDLYNLIASSGEERFFRISPRLRLNEKTKKRFSCCCRLVVVIPTQKLHQKDKNTKFLAKEWPPKIKNSRLFKKKSFCLFFFALVLLKFHYLGQINLSKTRWVSYQPVFDLFLTCKKKKKENDS